MRWILLVGIISISCVRTVYLPEDAAEYKRKLDECEASQKVLMEKIELYIEEVDKLAVDCR